MKVRPTFPVLVQSFLRTGLAKQRMRVTSPLPATVTPCTR